MKRSVQILVVAVAMTFVSGVAAAESLVLRDFENEWYKLGDSVRDKTTKQDIAGGYRGPNSTSVVSIEVDKTAVGKQALHVEWDNKDWAGVGIGLASKLFITEGYKAFRISIRGEGTNQKISIQLFDKGNEIHWVTVEDDSEDWKVVEIPFADFEVRQDYQPAGAKKNEVLDFPVRTINLESGSGGTFDFWVDQIEAVK